MARQPEKPAYPKQDAQRRKTPQRLDFGAPQEPAGASRRPPAPQRPVYDFDREAATVRSAGKKAGPQRLDFRAAPEPEPAPFVNTVPPSVPPAAQAPAPTRAAPRPAQGTASRTARVRGAWQAPQARPARPKPPHAPVYDQQKEAPRARAPEKPKKRGFFAALALVHRQNKARRAARKDQPLTPAQARARKVRRALLAAAALTVALVAGGLVSIHLIFKVKSVEVTLPEAGAPPYSAAEIKAAFGQPLGDNLLGFDAAATAKRMAEELPYLETVTIARKFPDTVLITVTGAHEDYKIPYGGGWAVLSGAAKVLRVTPEEPEALMELIGVAAVSPQPGKAVVFDDEEKQRIFGLLCTYIGKHGLVPAAEIDLTDTLELSYLYDQRVRIVLGTANELDYKLGWAARLLTQQVEDAIGPEETGTLDVSHRNAEGRGEAVWSAGVLDRPAHAAQPEPEGEAAAPQAPENSGELVPAA